MSHLTDFQTFLLLSILKVLVVLVITLTAVAYTVLLERKVLGRIQNRWGPSRVGPFGLLQPLADGIKLFLKEDLMPIASERPLFIIAPIIALTCALISIAVVPFGQQTMYHGVDLFELQGGCDTPLTRTLGVGPFFSLTFGRYTNAIQDGRSSDLPAAMHEWLIVGARGRVDL